MNELDFRTKNGEFQAKFDKWDQEIGRFIPKDFENLARSSGAIIRQRGVEKPVDLLKVLLIWAASNISLRMLSLCACALGVSTISDTAWRKKIVNSSLLLIMALNLFLPKPPPPNRGIKWERTIHLIDASSIVQQGKNGATFRIHMCYDLKTGRMGEVVVTDNRTAESFDLYSTIKEGDILIADAGYGSFKNVDYALKRKADVIIRITPNTIRLIGENGEVINMAKILDTEESVIEKQYSISYKNGLLPVRVIASRLPEDKIDAAKKRKKKEAQKRQSVIKEETLIYAEWVILITTLDDTYSAKEVLDIYRSRWQIELLFKRIKQHFKVTKIRPSSKRYAVALITLWLIIWALAERSKLIGEWALIKKGIGLNSRYSAWTVSDYYFHRIKTIIESVWSTILDPVKDIDLILKRLQNHKSSRVNQYVKYNWSNFPWIEA